jgi:streptomycin 6-kinase
MEAEHEAEGLRFWDGDPTVRLLAAEYDLGAMLLERCQPGTPLRDMPESEQDVVIAGLLRRLWRAPSSPHPFRPLSALMKFWSNATLANIKKWREAGLVREGLRLFEELPRTAPKEVLLATDLHAGNVLRSRRVPWLVIDPKPFIGDPAYDVTQHLFNCLERLLSDPIGLIRRMGDLAGVDHERIKMWTFARVAVDAPDDWSYEDRIAITGATAP